MEIEKSKTSNGQTYIRFKDAFDVTCRITSSGRAISIKIGLDYAVFNQEDIQALLPYLQSFTETGQLEPQQSPSVTSAEEHGKYLLQKYNELPQPRIIPLQVDELTEAFDPENLIRVSAEQNFKLYEQEKRIKALEMLLKEWMEFTSSQVPGKLNIQHADFEVWSKCRSELRERTSQLLGE